jgi:uncharacterized protein (TIGR00251 family)
MSCLKAVADGVEITIKVVPGASRDGIVGLLGDALKVRVSAPPEKGKANAAVIELLAEALGVSVRSISVISGAASPRKILHVSGQSLIQVQTALGIR